MHINQDKPETAEDHAGLTQVSSDNQNVSELNKSPSKRHLPAHSSLPGIVCMVRIQSMVKLDVRVACTFKKKCF